MTDRAVTLLRNLREEADLPESTGVRIYSESDESGRPMLSIGFTPEPAPTDEVAEQGGLRLFVASDVASPLAGAVMDVVGEDGESQLVFRPAAESDGAGGLGAGT
ncbi:MAG TPA: hypothetical protein VFH63_06920 [candidate division Zixibacteria bacterium]|nr:hypothetical protein [candidate division Zixibacteria bacterium]